MYRRCRRYSHVSRILARRAAEYEMLGLRDRLPLRTLRFQDIAQVPGLIQSVGSGLCTG